MTSPAPSISRRVSRKASQFTESVIREMTREAMKHGAVNLSQGFPDFSAPEDIKRKAMEAIAADVGVPLLTTRREGRKRFIYRGKPRSALWRNIMAFRRDFLTGRGIR